MKLVLENIGMLKSAEINLESLSVIAGENDNGKSTVGKVVFCIIKAINRYKEDLQESKEFKINEIFENIFFDLRREIFTLGDDPSETLSKIKLLSEEGSALEDRLVVLEDFITRLKSNSEPDKELLKKLSQHYEAIKKLANEPENVRKSIENALNKVFASEFDSSVLLSGAKEGFIKLYEKELILIDIKISDDNKVQLLNDAEPIELKDATFVESPLILNNHDLLIRSQSGLSINKRNIHRLGIPYTTLHTKDLFDKLIEPSVVGFFDLDEEDESFTKYIASASSGEVIYDRQKRDFIYQQEGKDISIKNTASGIKVFGILQLLSNNGFINKNSILIFDEPENHLHPKWQLKLAKVLVDLAKHGLYILVSSHSPYMIEALKRFSDKQGLETEAGFYLAENNSIENRNRLEDTFRVLSEPFEIFRQMDEELLSDE